MPSGKGGTDRRGVGLAGAARGRCHQIRLPHLNVLGTL